MASITRCLRAARPSSFSSFSYLSCASTRASIPRAAPILPLQRPFTSSSIFFERKYTKDHEWIEISADRQTAVVGITEYAADQLGDVVYVELPQPGNGATPDGWFQQGDPIGAVESVKSAADINAPLRCRVTQSNVALDETPDTIGKVPEDDSHGGGWIAKVELDSESLKGLDKLMDPTEYKTFTAQSDH